MKTKLGVMVGNKFQESLVKLSKSDMPLKTAFKVKGLIKSVAEESKKFNELRDQLVDKYGQKDADGKLIVGEDQSVPIQKDKLEEFSKSFQELLDVEVELPQVSANDLGKVELSGADLFVLESVIGDLE